MAGMQPNYDDSIELEVNALFCSLDKNPKVCINPVESSKYLNFTLAVSEEGFQQHVEASVKRFLAYLNQFTKECIDAGAVKSLLIPTVSRLLTSYRQALYTFTHSPLRMEWKAFSTDYTVVRGQYPHVPKNAWKACLGVKRPFREVTDTVGKPVQP